MLSAIPHTFEAYFYFYLAFIICGYLIILKLNLNPAVLKKLVLSKLLIWQLFRLRYHMINWNLVWKDLNVHLLLFQKIMLFSFTNPHSFQNIAEGQNALHRKAGLHAICLIPALITIFHIWKSYFSTRSWHFPMGTNCAPLLAALFLYS